jgi:thioredoxin-like negative regulator of GroEL
MAKQFALSSDGNGSEWLNCKNYKKTIKEQDKSVVVFWSESCGTCAQIMNKIDSIGDKPGISWAFVDVDVCNKAADATNIDVTPTIVVNSKGRELYRLDITGNVTKDLETLSGYLDTL